MSARHHVRRRSRLAFLICAGLLLAVWSVPAAARTTGNIAIDQVNDSEDTISFTFTSTWPRGTSCQAEFLRALDDTRADIPDARIEPLEVEGGFWPKP